MNNKKMGVVLGGASILLLVIFILMITSLNQEIKALGCFENQGCKSIETKLTIVHVAFGVFGFLFALAFYLFFFSQGERAIIERLEADTQKKLTEDKFSLILKGLDEFERTVVKILREEEGITQNSLHLRANLSKAKLSQVLTTLEKKGLIRREPQKKTYAVYLREKV